MASSIPSIRQVSIPRVVPKRDGAASGGGQQFQDELGQHDLEEEPHKDVPYPPRPTESNGRANDGVTGTQLDITG